MKITCEKGKEFSGMKRQSLFVFVIMMFLLPAVNAQTTSFYFQATLPNEITPATGSFEMQIKVFDSLTDGSEVATNHFEDVDVKTRTFTVVLDYGAAAFSGGDRFIEVRLRRKGSQQSFTTVTPRWKILSVPYAIRALNATTADNISGVNLDDFVQTTDPRLSDARDPLPGSTYYIQNTTSLQTSANFNVDGTGTATVFNAGTQYNIGSQRVLSNAGTNNLFAGVGAGTANTGNGNAFFGAASGEANADGSFNSFFGLSSGIRNTSGKNNAFFGAFAGQNNVSGESNSFFGFVAGLNNTANDNSFFGRGAGFTNTTGTRNSFFGRNASDFNSTGGSNSSFGFNAGKNNTTGNRNTFIGASSGFTNTTGNDITIIGANANVGANNLNFASAIGSYSIVSSNDTVVIGKTAGLYDGVSRPADAVSIPGNLTVGGTFNANALNISGTFSANTVNAALQFNLNNVRILSRPGTDNLFAGVLAGNSNTTGAGNSYFGLLAGSGNSTGSDNSYFGRRAGSISTGSGNSFFGSFAGANGAGPGSNNTFIGRNADFTITQSEGYNNTLLGADAKIDVITNGTVLRFAAAIGAGAKVSFSDMIVIGKAAGVYDGVSRPADIVRTAGVFQPALASPGGSPVCFNNGISLCSSSLRYKTDIQTFTGGLDLVKRLMPITFSWRDDGRRDVGFGAEEVFKIEPLLTFRNQNGEIEGVQYAQISTILVNSVKEQQTQIEQLQEQNKQFLQQIEALKKLVCQTNKEAQACK